MLSKLLTHTPGYVWALLALLVWRGAAALRSRETTPARLCVIPCIMVPLALLDIAHKFGFASLPLSAWTLGLAAAMVLVWKLGGTMVAPVAAPGRVRVAGSVLPLLLMLAIFVLKYSTSALLAVSPALLHAPGVAAASCALSGAASGYFLGRLLRDLADCRAGAPGAPARALGPR